ncbi:MAG: low-specificity L-threonine aldolase [Synergistaceae bacterium]|nr:low-specificity L-threonine aldolase [Synergistaceae bacterium]
MSSVDYLTDYLTEEPIDLKSDTITKPSAEMRKAMSQAEVGDDVYGEDPTVVRLEEKGAELLGKEAALYVTSGTQGNLVSLLTHCGRGDGAIVGKDSHILNNEGGGLCALGGIVAMQVEDRGSLPSVSDLNYLLHPKDNVHFAQARLLCLENTHNRGGGYAASPEEVAELVGWAHGHGLAVHVDGARLFNAAVAQNVEPSALVKDVDSVQICLSKGLGAPMGSLICASRDFVERARFWRKKVGGGLRQAGIVAAAGLYALEHNIDRLAEDHENARRVKDILQKGGLRVPEVGRPTNMVYFGTPDEARADKLLAACRKRRVIFNKTAPDTFRLVMHLDVGQERAAAAAKIIVEEYRG